MRILPPNSAKLTAPSSLFDPVIEQRTRAILDAVQARGDAALLEFTEKFDGAKLAAGRLAITQAELFNASLAADESLRAAVAEAEKNIVALRQKVAAQKLADEKFAWRDRRREI